MNPYEVLGVREGASEAEIKAAYKELVKKYHPDKYVDNPLADLAEQKMQEINQAYDTLMKGGAAAGGYNAGPNNGGNPFGQNGPFGPGGPFGQGSPFGQQARPRQSDFIQVRRDIDGGRLDAAETALNNSSNRNAEWFFLKGVVASRKGWYDEAMNNLQTAVNMDPENVEFRQHYAAVANRGNVFRNQAQGRGYQQAGGDDFCCQALQCYICADCCCDCM
ncbi:MAG: J domain-containing protein [Bacillota bacterium]|nr:J domain-containing protein [Bacillota bacterium]